MVYSSVVYWLSMVDKSMVVPFGLKFARLVLDLALSDAGLLEFEG